MLVPLSSGKTVDVGSLTWKAYKRLKTLVLQQCSSEILEAVTELRTGGDFSEGLKKLSSIVGSVLSTMDEEFLLGCIRHSEGAVIHLDDLSFGDIAKLFAAARELNPVESILAFEKNSPAGTLAAQLLSNLSSVPGASQALRAAGGSVLNQLSPSDTAGAPAT